MKRTVKILILIVLIAGAASLLEFFVARKNIKQPLPQTQSNVSALPQNETAPTAATAVTESQIENSPDSSPAPDTTHIPSPDPLPEKFLLQVPFYSQAPLGKWDNTHENACEEASVLNAGLYLLGKKLSPSQFDQEIMSMIKIEKKLSINFTDSTIAETKQFSDSYFAGKINSKIIVSPTIEDIEAEITAGNPVIVPLSGRDIGNPNFTPPGPVYHMLVVKGYDAQNFITNDVGTRKGDSYTYAKDVIMKNMHDWNKTDIHLGAKKILVLFK